MSLTTAEVASFLNKRIKKDCDFCTNKLNSRTDFWGCFICEKCVSKSTTTKFEGLNFSTYEMPKMSKICKIVK